MKKIGIIFIGKGIEKEWRKRIALGLRSTSLWFKRTRLITLDFDELACIHLILQMNYVQNLFEYRVIRLDHYGDQIAYMNKVSVQERKREKREDEIINKEFIYKLVPLGSNHLVNHRALKTKIEKKLEEWKKELKNKIPGESRNECLQDTTKDDYKIIRDDGGKVQCLLSETDDYIVQWFDVIISELSKNGVNMDYWIGITSNDVGGNFFLRTRRGEESDKYLSVISSKYWERHFSPPSLFEYLALYVFVCSLRSMICNSKDQFLKHKEVRGCIFDVPTYKPHRRILVSNPNLCAECLRKIEDELTELHLQTQTINDVLSKEWMGNKEKIGSPIFNLKKNYKYDIDRNSGFFKKPFEKLRDSILDNVAEWIIGTIATIALSILLIHFGIKIPGL